MPEFEKLRSRREFLNLYRRGRFFVIRGLFCVEFNLLDQRDVNRFGFTASKKVGGAVLRNRAKRRLRELVRKFEPKMKSGFECNFIATKATPFARWSEIEKAMMFFLKKNNLVLNHSTKQSFQQNRGSRNYAPRR